MLLRFAAVIALWLAANATARATCGDYVHVLPPGATSEQPADGPKPCPCQGPSCGQQPATPAPVPVSTTQLTHPSDAILVLANDVEPTSVAFLGDQDVSASAGSRLSIFHPPR